LSGTARPRRLWPWLLLLALTAGAALVWLVRPERDPAIPVPGNEPAVTGIEPGPAAVGESAPPAIGRAAPTPPEVLTEKDRRHLGDLIERKTGDAAR
jgi:hypothetical protein